MAADEVEATVAEIRDRVREHGHREPQWWVPESAEPPDLPRRLEALGFSRPPRDPELAAMALDREPSSPSSLEARPARDFAEWLAGMEIQLEAFGRDDAAREEIRAVAERRHETEHVSGQAPQFLAFLDGEVVATAVAVTASRGLLLVGGATLPRARGRGAYRALVRARWEFAVERGTPALVVQAGAMSQPILERIGFERVSTIRRYVDRGLGIAGEAAK